MLVEVAAELLHIVIAQRRSGNSSPVDFADAAYHVL